MTRSPTERPRHGPVGDLARRRRRRQRLRGLPHRPARPRRHGPRRLPGRPRPQFVGCTVGAVSRLRGRDVAVGTSSIAASARCAARGRRTSAPVPHPHLRRTSAGRPSDSRCGTPRSTSSADRPCHHRPAGSTRPGAPPAGIRCGSRCAAGRSRRHRGRRGRLGGAGPPRGRCLAAWAPGSPSSPSPAADDARRSRADVVVSSTRRRWPRWRGRWTSCSTRSDRPRPHAVPRDRRPRRALHSATSAPSRRGDGAAGGPQEPGVGGQRRGRARAARLLRRARHHRRRRVLPSGRSRPCSNTRAQRVRYGCADLGAWRVGRPRRLPASG